MHYPPRYVGTEVLTRLRWSIPLASPEQTPEQHAAQVNAEALIERLLAGRRNRERNEREVESAATEAADLHKFQRDMREWAADHQDDDDDFDSGSVNWDGQPPPPLYRMNADAQAAEGDVSVVPPGNGEQWEDIASRGQPGYFRLDDSDLDDDDMLAPDDYDLAADVQRGIDQRVNLSRPAPRVRHELDPAADQYDDFDDLIDEYAGAESARETGEPVSYEYTARGGTGFVFGGAADVEFVPAPPAPPAEDNPAAAAGGAAEPRVVPVRANIAEPPIQIQIGATTLQIPDPERLLSATSFAIAQGTLASTVPVVTDVARRMKILSDATHDDDLRAAATAAHACLEVVLRHLHDERDLAAPKRRAPWALHSIGVLGADLLIAALSVSDPKAAALFSSAKAFAVFFLSRTDDEHD